MSSINDPKFIYNMPCDIEVVAPKHRSATWAYVGAYTTHWGNPCYFVLHPGQNLDAYIYSPAVRDLRLLAEPKDGVIVITETGRKFMETFKKGDGNEAKK